LKSGNDSARRNSGCLDFDFHNGSLSTVFAAVGNGLSG
jgi:hypothetical protein